MGGLGSGLLDPEVDDGSQGDGGDRGVGTSAIANFHALLIINKPNMFLLLFTKGTFQWALTLT